MWKNLTAYLQNVKQQNKLLNILNCLFLQRERNTHTEKIDPFRTSLTGECCTHRAFVSSTKAKQCHTQEQGYREMEYLWWWRKSFRKLPGSRGPGEWQMGQTSGICSHMQPHSHSRFFPCGRIASAEILSKFKLFEFELKSMDIKGKIHKSKLEHRQRPQPPSWDLLGEQCIRIWEKPFSVGRSTYKTHGLAVDEARNKSSVS